MPRFLHLADVHLGYDRYDSPERTEDFAHALMDALKKYAITPRVDFVLIAGDLFEHKNVLPATLDQAQACLEKLKQANIPVLAIEGNHDNHPYGTKASWLNYLANWDWLILLEPNENAAPGEPIFDLWTPETRHGGYIDLKCGVRVIGSYWYGSSAPQAIQGLAAGLQHLPPAPGPTVMMFHHGLEGQIARYSGALRYDDLLPLKEAGVDYLALGHIHKNYSYGNWIFNPGSVEANSIAESQEQNPRGVYLVEINNQGITAELKRDYTQRPILRLNLDAKKQWIKPQLEQEALALMESAIQAGKTQAAIVELRISGQVGFNRLDLDVRGLRDRLHRLSGALIFLLKYDAVGTEYDSTVSLGDEPPSRLEIEQQVFVDLLAANVNYNDRSESLAKGLIDLKERILSGRSEQDLYGFVQELLNNTKPSKAVGIADKGDVQLFRTALTPTPLPEGERG